MNEIELHISPCPNDTFAFHAMLHGLVDTEGITYKASFADIEQLNTGVINTAPTVSKISYAVLPEISSRYEVLDSGSALGRGNGPLLVRAATPAPASGPDPQILTQTHPSSAAPLPTHSLSGCKIAVPGLHTTANLLMERIFPEATEKYPLLFSEIADAVANGRFEAGVLIHEGRFTYKSYGLELIADLGQLWEAKYGIPLPLGGITIKRQTPLEIKLKVERTIARSVQYALLNPSASIEFVKGHAREMDLDVIKSHISLFVNDFTISLGNEGREAVRILTGLQSHDIFLKS